MGVAFRKNALLGWLQKGDSGSLMDTPMAMTELFRPKIFLNALRQQTARQSGVPIGDLKLTASFNNLLLPKSASVPVAATGLLLQGCGFTDNMLSALVPDSPTTTGLPQCTLAWMQVDDKEPY